MSAFLGVCVAHGITVAAVAGRVSQLLRTSSGVSVQCELSHAHLHTDIPLAHSRWLPCARTLASPLCPTAHPFSMDAPRARSGGRRWVPRQALPPAWPLPSHQRRCPPTPRHARSYTRGASSTDTRRMRREPCRIQFHTRSSEVERCGGQEGAVLPRRDVDAVQDAPWALARRWRGALVSGWHGGRRAGRLAARRFIATWWRPHSWRMRGASCRPRRAISACWCPSAVRSHFPEGGEFSCAPLRRATCLTSRSREGAVTPRVGSRIHGSCVPGNLYNSLPPWAIWSSAS